MFCSILSSYCFNHMYPFIKVYKYYAIPNKGEKLLGYLSMYSRVNQVMQMASTLVNTGLSVTFPCT
jgi:hypothetical protein